MTQEKPLNVIPAPLNVIPAQAGIHLNAHAWMYGEEMAGAGL
jgi:hypothetical protein